jgi:hypothetical protein
MAETAAWLQERAYTSGLDLWVLTIPEDSIRDAP